MSSPSNVTPKKSKTVQFEPGAPVKKRRVVVPDPGPEFAHEVIDLTQAPEEIDLTSEDDESVQASTQEFKELCDAIEYQCSEISGDDKLVLVEECQDCRKLKVPVCDLCTCGYDEHMFELEPTCEAKCDCEKCM